MLNISENSIRDEVAHKDIKSLNMINSYPIIRKFAKTVGLLFIIALAIMFLPWTQNVRGQGQVTTLLPSQRVQSLQSAIDGRIEEWYANEGDTVSRGDTIVFISEIKSEYWDPRLIERTEQQIQAKREAIENYQLKAQALRDQITALEDLLVVKMSQLRLKVESDSMDWVAAGVSAEIAEFQLRRADTLFAEGLITQVKYESNQQKMQEANAKRIGAYNKWQQAIAELESTRAEYAEKLAKARSDLYSTESMVRDAQGSLAKLENQKSNYELRADNYYIRAPKNGILTRAIKQGIGENVKAGENIAMLVPLDFQMAVEIFVRPVDLPLLHEGQKARIEFDGWPAIVFSGWPNTSFGTFGAKIYAVESQVSPNGLYRVLLEPDEHDAPWPPPLRFGGGAEGMLLLNDVPVWYEIWRQINGFPPEYYTGPSSGTNAPKSGGKK